MSATCPTCGGPGVAMLTSVACDACDAKRAYDAAFAEFQAAPFEPIPHLFDAAQLAAWNEWMDAAILRVYESCGVPASMLVVMPSFDAAGAVVIRDIAEGE